MKRLIPGAIITFLVGVLIFQLFLLIKPHEVMVGNKLVEMSNKVGNYSDLIKSQRIKDYFTILDKYGHDYQIEYYETFNGSNGWNASGDVFFSSGKSVMNTKGNKTTYLFKDIDLSNSKYPYLFALAESKIESSDNESGQLAFYFDAKPVIILNPNKMLSDVIAGRDSRDFVFNLDGAKKTEISFALWGSDKLNFSDTANIDELVIFSAKSPDL